eukprot:13145778-Heterocapsa_arctica.AAC.1
MQTRHDDLRGLPAESGLFDERRPSAMQELVRPCVQKLLRAVASRSGVQWDDHRDPGSDAHARRPG